MECNNCGKPKARNGYKVNGDQRYKCTHCSVEKYDDNEMDIDMDEITDVNVKLHKKIQKLTDTQRIERKAVRDYVRQENALVELNNELVKVISDNSLSKVTKVRSAKRAKVTGIIQVTDVHFNELVHACGDGSNSYDFKVAAKRFKLYIDESVRYLKFIGVKAVLLAFTGDLLTSDRRMDEILHLATNRSKAIFLSVDILQQVILDLNKEFNVTVAYVTGNEGRTHDDNSFSEIMASDNYDWVICNTLSLLFKGSKGVKFVTGHAKEVVVEVQGQNVLLIHGDSKSLKGANTTRNVQNVIGKYASKGTQISFVLLGHKHEVEIGPFFARGGSMVGANEYSDKDLQFISRATQCIHTIDDVGHINSLKIDLQNVDHIKGYNIDESLEEYNPQAHKKLFKQTTIVKVVI